MRAAARLAFERGFRIERFGQHHVPEDGPALLVSNHPTYVDPFLVGYCLERWITWMAWEEAFSWPGIGWLFRHMGAFPVNTEKPAPSTFKTAFEVLAQGRLLGVFIEGGRTRQSEFGLDPPQPGAARIAVRAQIPVIPVSISGARRAWPLDRRLPRPGKVWVRFHPPVDPSALGGRGVRQREAALNEVIAGIIREALPEDGRHRAWPGRA
jgi:1-acyl-sn-glycerol-3-phosphate acyltransferase